jgi:hypothetical protein
MIYLIVNLKKVLKLNRNSNNLILHFITFVVVFCLFHSLNLFCRFVMRYIFLIIIECQEQFDLIMNNNNSENE